MMNKKLRSKTVIYTLLYTLMSTFIAAFSTSAMAKRGNEYHDYAKVIDSTPVYEIVELQEPYEHCWNEQVRVDRSNHHSSATGTLVGGIIGGAIGNAVGHSKRNKQVGTAVGAILGMSIGHDISHQNHHQRHHKHKRPIYRQARQCETRYHIRNQRQLMGYDVKYRYKGKTHHTHMHKQPGKRIKVVVNVKPKW